MEQIIIGVILGVLLTTTGWWILRPGRRKPRASGLVELRSSVESIKSVGELVVLKVFTQQIVTKSDHPFGMWGEKWMNWLLSSKKTAMVFDFVVEFRYNLRDPAFEIDVDQTRRAVKFKMPPCFYEIQLRNISIYDERASVLAPILLPEWLGQVFGGRFSEQAKNQLIQGAREKADKMALDLTQRMIGEVHASAESSLHTIARGLGFETTAFDFHDRLPRGSVDISKLESGAQQAVTDSPSQ